MTPKVKGWDELHLAENPAVELLQSLGYTYLTPDELELERGSTKVTILTDRLGAALKRLNPWLSDDNVTKAVKAVTQVPAASLAEANEAVYTSLTYGISLEQDRGDGRKSHTVRFIDFDTPSHNEWVVTRQYKVFGSKKHVLPDVVAFVNGLPLVVIECKSPTIGDKWKAEAVKQLRRYQEADTRWKDQGAPKLFEATQILVGCCGERAVYGTVGTPERFFLEWKEPYPLTVEQLGDEHGRTPTPQDILLYGLLEHRNLLDIVRNFVVFEVEGGRAVRKLTRYRQFIAVSEAMKRIRTATKPRERGGVVWHTTRVGQVVDDALAGTQATPRRIVGAPDRGHRHRPHKARPVDYRRVHGMWVPEPRTGRQRARPTPNPDAPDRQDGDDHGPEVSGNHRLRNFGEGSGPPRVIRGHEHLRDGR